jgi:hypothetical protein
MPIEFAQSVNAPGAASFTIPKMDFSWIANLPQQYYAGQQSQHQLAVQNLFKNGLPTVDGKTTGESPNAPVDYQAAANALFAKGAFPEAAGMQQTAIDRAALANAQNIHNDWQSMNSAAPVPAAPIANNSSAPADYNSIVARRESGNNPTVTPNATTGAAGRYGFLPSTWSSIAQNHPELNLPPTIAQATPEQQDAAQNAYTGDNAKTLQGAGIPVTDRTLNMAHFLGAGGATKFFGALKQNPGAPAASIFPTEAAANPTLFFAPDSSGRPGKGAPLSLGQLYASQAKQFGPGLTTLNAPQPSAGVTGGNPAPPVADGLAIHNQTPAALHAANAATAVRGAAQPATTTPAAPIGPAPGAPAGPQAATGQVQAPWAGALRPQQPDATASGAPPVASQQQQPQSELLRDPTMGGMVPQAFVNRFGPTNAAAAYARWLDQAAAALKSNKVTAPSAEPYEKAAVAIQNRLAQMNLPTDEQKNYLAFGLPGESEADYEARTARAKTEAEQNVQDQHTLVQVYSPDGGPAQWVPRSSLLGQGQPGASAVPTNAERLPVVAQGQKTVQDYTDSIGPQYVARQEARQRLDAISDILSKFQTGALAESKADAQAFARSIGIPFPDNATWNAAAVQELTKNALKNVFTDLKSIGGRPLVSEIQGLSKATTNADLQPEANAAILAQAKGLLDFHDQHDADFMDWRKANPTATNTAAFDIPWIKSHPLQPFVDSAAKGIAARGTVIPPPAQRVVGQRYVGPKGVGVWTGHGWQMVQ